MQHSRHWAWAFYFALIFFLVTQKVYAFFSPDAHPYFYYSFLKYFHFRYMFVYGAALVQVILNVVHLVPLILFITCQEFLNKKFWQTLFILRIFFDIFGHSFEIQELISYYHLKPLICLLIFIKEAAPYIPSYIACYLYAFGRPPQENK